MYGVENCLMIITRFVNCALRSLGHLVRARSSFSHSSRSGCFLLTISNVTICIENKNIEVIGGSIPRFFIANKTVNNGSVQLRTCSGFTIKEATFRMRCENECIGTTQSNICVVRGLMIKLYANTSMFRCTASETRAF